MRGCVFLTLASKMVTSRPNCWSWRAAISPLTPAPTTITLNGILPNLNEDALISAEPSLHVELLALSGHARLHACLRQTTLVLCKQKQFKEEKRYCWTRIHHFGLNCLNASADKVQQSNWDFKKENFHHCQELLF